MSADLEKLLPCPFCGGEAKTYVSRDDDHDRYGEVCCTGCSASVRGPHLHWMDNTADEIASQFQAEMGWNRRTTDLARQVIALTAENTALRAKAEKLAEAACSDAEQSTFAEWQEEMGVSENDLGDRSKDWHDGYDAAILRLRAALT
ncbi:Lar family restriction alleviation protein [Neotabrizicola sp. sgz301269]|uniref:Lar family restriction alleviation protein n=1 Tax=Neotabrizicola sp. sgz301269 TaxID=3276282 RepID=UPI00376FF2F4